MSARLYEPCTLCHGSDDVEGFEHCPGCKGRGFVEIGLTVNQLERLRMKAEALDRIAQQARTVKPEAIAEAQQWLGGVGAANCWDFVAAATNAVVAMREILEEASGPLFVIRTPHQAETQETPQ